MKKTFKGIICAGICASFALTGLVGCSGGNSAHRDPETSPLRLAIGAVDNNFNPLFYTSANDGTIANLTQAGLMTSDENGELAYGENYPVITQDYKEIYYSDANATNQIATSDGKEIEASCEGAQSTAYEFVIKNGVKFSDGVELTVMDVLFNLYVYLDPLYSGSSTIYSTKIQGLQAYRQQDPDADDSSSGENLTQYYANAQQRISDLIAWANEEKSPTDQMKKDLKTVKKLYKQELESDWNSISTSWQETYKDYYFDEAWKAYYFAEGLINKQSYYNSNNVLADRFYDANDNGKRDDGEKYLTGFDPVFGESDPINIDPTTSSKPIGGSEQNYINEMNSGVTNAQIEAYVASHEGYTYEDAKLKLQGEYAVDFILETRVGNANDDTMGNDIQFVLSYSATASNAFDEFVKDERAKDVPEGELTVKSISGITVRKTKTFHGKDLGEDHDVLRIVINGVDPKAKWNFSFAVTPMHYYSDAAHTAAAMADYNSGKIYNGTASNFGVQYKSAEFMNDVLAASTKTNLPVGAGAYKATSHKMNGEQVTGANFHYNKITYFERNEYFKTLGDGIDNAKIKYVTYKEMSDDKIVSALKANEIDYGTPIAKAVNQTEVNYGDLKQTTYQTGGYGYVGINPKSEKLRSVYVRQAIMYAFDTSSIVEYYGQSLVSLINRPMSLTSWASPENPDNITATTPAPDRYYEMTNDVLNGKSQEEFLRELVNKSGTYYYNEDSGKIVSRTNEKQQLEITFTIAGETTDHPSYSMFIAAKSLLERVGFKINVEYSALALQKLTTGDLEVWAAAWSSSIDPDPYQTYSMYSNASSTKNWYKTGIEQDGGYGDLAYEYEIATMLTEKIELGRQQLNRQDRKTTYGRSSTTKKLYETEFGSSEFDDVLSKLCTLDLIMEMAVEFPTYQRNELCVYNSSVLDESTMRIKDASFNMGPIDELWKVGYRK